MSCTGGTGSTILLRRSTTAGATPGLECLTVGELVLNAADGKLFTKGSTGNVLFTFSNDGSTADDVVLSVNGATGNVTFQFVSSFNGATGAVQGVGSFNGATGAIVGVNSVNGATGAVTFADLVGVCSVNGFTGAVDFTTKTFHAAGFSTQGGITAAGNLNLSGGLCGDHANFVGLTVDHISVAGGNVARTNSTNTFAELQEFAKGISIDAGGITFADGTQQTTAFRAGLKYTVTHTGVVDIPSAGGVKMASNISGTAIDILSIHDTDANGNDISSIMTLFADNGGFVQVLKEDGTELLIAAVDASETSTATFGSDVLQITGLSGIEVDTSPSVNDVVYVYIIPNLVNAVQTIAGQQGNIQVHRGLTMEIIAGVGYLGVLPEAMSFQSPTSGGRVIGITFNDNSVQTTAALADINTATFSLLSSSAIATGAKTTSLHRVPFDATLTKFEMKAGTGGFSGGIYVAGSDFGLPTTGAVTGCSLGVSGFTGETTVFNSPTITAGNYLYFQVFNNTNGATNAQAFLTYTRR